MADTFIDKNGSLTVLGDVLVTRWGRAAVAGRKRSATALTTLPGWQHGLAGLRWARLWPGA